MGLFEHFPYTNYHDLNLDKILERTKEAEEAVAASEAAALAAAADASAADGKATTALNTANNAKNTADQAALDAGAAQDTADQAILDAAAALGVANSALTPVVVSSSDWIDTDNTTVGILDSFAVRIGNIFFFELQLNNVSVDHRMFRFKAPYNNAYAPTECALYTKSGSSTPYDTFVGMYSIIGSGIKYFAFTNVTLTYHGYISGVMLLTN